MKILAIQNRMGIGDMVIFLPFIEAISKKYQTPISILVKENSKAKEYLIKNKLSNSKIYEKISSYTGYSMVFFGKSIFTEITEFEDENVIYLESF